MSKAKVIRDEILISGEKVSNFSNSNCEEVARICHPLFKKTPINYFDYTRYYDTGEMIPFSTSPDFNTRYYIDCLYPSLEELNLGHSFGLKSTFLSHHLPLPAVVGDLNPDRYNGNIACAAEFNIYHRLYFIERGKDYYYTSGFGLPSNNKADLDFYVNAGPKLKEFIKYFEYHARHLIANGLQHHSVYMPSYCEKILEMPNNFEEPFNIASLDFSVKTEAQFKMGEELTSREKECLSLIAQGYTAKNVARMLQISPRTVETHLAHIKDKHGLHSKNQIVELWHEIYEK